jgi:hypothetical protein
MGYATLGAAGRTQLAFRIDPQAVEWNVKINTNVEQTLGGRVVQVLGATVSDITIVGSIGEDHSKAATGGASEHPGRSWKLAEAFVTKIRNMQREQAEYALLSSSRRKTAAPLIFHYPPKSWRFAVYIKNITDPQGGVITHTTGRFSYQYRLTLFIEQDATGALVRAGTSNGVLDQKKADAVAAYIARISDGIGWHISQYNGPPSAAYVAAAPAAPPKPQGVG